MFWVYTAAITFDLKLSYVLVGWEGSAHDSCVLNDTLNRPKRLQIPKDILGLKSDFFYLFLFLFFLLWIVMFEVIFNFSLLHCR